MKNKRIIYWGGNDHTIIPRMGACGEGVDAEPGRKLLYMHFEIDTSANEKLIQSSLEKYSDYAIYG